MRTTWSALTSCCLLMGALALAGCASSNSSSSTATAAQAAEARANREIALQSPVVTGASTIPSRYTCDGGDTRLPLQWASVPPGTKELVAMIFSVQPVTSEGKPTNTLVAKWAVAGLPPTLRELTSGPLPHGAVVGRDEQGDPHYSLCPQKGVKWNYLVALFALPSRIRAAPGVNDEVLFSYLNKARVPYGELYVNYTRR